MGVLIVCGLPRLPQGMYGADFFKYLVARTRSRENIVEPSCFFHQSGEQL
jgi:hypothetical protein